jgi:hypothetical protein
MDPINLRQSFFGFIIAALNLFRYDDQLLTPNIADQELFNVVLVLAEIV